MSQRLYQDEFFYIGKSLKQLRNKSGLHKKL